eukprot:754398-Hanusia_phi.AAC.1
MNRDSDMYGSGNDRIEIFVTPRDKNDLRQGKKMFQISQKQIESLFHLRQTEAAAYLGISLTAMKAACRRVGISKWPYSRIRPKTIIKLVSPTPVTAEEASDESTVEYSPSPSKPPSDTGDGKQDHASCDEVQAQSSQSCRQEQSTNILPTHPGVHVSDRIYSFESFAIDEQGKDLSQRIMLDFPFEPLDESWIRSYMKDSITDEF